MGKNLEIYVAIPLLGLSPEKMKTLIRKVTCAPMITAILFTIAKTSVQFSRSVVPSSLRHHGLQHARPPCPSPTPEFTQTCVHWVGDGIQPSHPLLSPSPPAVNISQHQGLFQWVSWNNPWNQRKRGSKSQTLRQSIMNKIQYFIYRKVCSACCHLLQEALPRPPLGPLTSVLPLLVSKQSMVVYLPDSPVSSVKVSAWLRQVPTKELLNGWTELRHIHTYIYPSVWFNFFFFGHATWYVGS